MMNVLLDVLSLIPLFMIGYLWDIQQTSDTKIGIRDIES